MKIEKVNDNQIRCTLTKEDLASRELKISELAYGTEKAKNLFRDMMQQANFEFGFEAEDIPLMIEAIPMNAECIVLIITKVEDPEELDTRFSRFAPSIHDEEAVTEDDAVPDASDEVLDLFRKIHESTQESIEIDAEAQPGAADTAADSSRHVVRLFQFPSLNPLLTLSSYVADSFDGDSVLYKERRDACYLLMLIHTSTSADSFNKVCNVISEYGIFRKVLPSTASYLEEHCDVIIPHGALKVLSGIA